MATTRKSRKYATTVEVPTLAAPRAAPTAPAPVIIRQYAPDSEADLAQRLRRLYADWLDVGYNTSGATPQTDD